MAFQLSFYCKEHAGGLVEQYSANRNASNIDKRKNPLILSISLNSKFL